MRLMPISFPGKQGLIQDYRNQNNNALRFFQYNPFQKGVYKQRLNDLSERTYQRSELVKVLHECNQKWGASTSTLDNIKRLEREDSVAVVGGQQAGLLTGPLYSIHKIISIIKLAKEQEKELGVPVIPIFWIAGEDHDFEEINHIYLPISPRMKKYKILQRQLKKESISQVKLDQREVDKWLENIFQNLDETEMTKDQYEKINKAAKESVTYVDFFAKVLFSLFKDDGIVLLDSGSPEIRHLESQYFLNFIKNRESIAYSVREALTETSKSNYVISLDAENDDGHLFYHHNGERVLLRVDGAGNWVGKNNECSFKESELIEIARNQPNLLSNNVVTRPIMQELLLPVLAFIGGPGEIAYWSVLNQAFKTMNVRMPPVVPRLSYTLVDCKSEKMIRQLALKINDLIQYGALTDKTSWLKRQMHPPIEQLTDQLKLTIEHAHRPIKESAAAIKSDLGQVAEKNLMLIFREIEYLEQRITYELQLKNQVTLQKYDWLEALLHPEGGLQERCWNVVYWLNKIGSEWIKELTEQPIDWEHEHYCVFL